MGNTPERKTVEHMYVTSTPTGHNEHYIELTYTLYDDGSVYVDDLDRAFKSEWSFHILLEDGVYDDHFIDAAEGAHLNSISEPGDR